nr:PREDICTED: programmed cell death 1 ligand 1-like [Lepisosteus oculatus]
MIHSSVAPGFSVQGPREPLVTRPGDEVLLPCSVDSAVPLQELEVEWLRTDPDTLVLLFSEGESRPESQHQSYRGRAELFPQEIPRGNFSLRLANFTVEDTGVYRCAVYTKEDSGQTTVELKEQERLAVSGASEPVAAYAGGEVVLNCSVDTNVPLQELEVEWLKTDSTILVHMFSEGESRPESQHQRYRGRAEFITERIPNGDFSLRLKDIRTEDKGEYMCIVHTDSGSANTTAELKELGFSTAHIWILLLALSALGVVLLTSVPACQFLLQNRETSWRWPCCLVNCVAPGLLLSVAFILWGQTEGFLQESVTCATVSVLRVLLVSMMASYSHWYPGNLGRILKRFSVPFVFFAFLTVVMSVILAEYFKTRAPDTAGKQTIGILSGLVFLSSLFGIVVKDVCVLSRWVEVTASRRADSRAQGEVHREITHTQMVSSTVPKTGQHK